MDWVENFTTFCGLVWVKLSSTNEIFVHINVEKSWIFIATLLITDFLPTFNHKSCFRIGFQLPDHVGSGQVMTSID